MNRRTLTMRRLYAVLCSDDRITPWHLAICIAVLFLGHQDGNSQGIQTSRRKIMQLARIRSIVTYHKCIRELTAFGYITYCPSYHPAKGSLIDLKIED